MNPKYEKPTVEWILFTECADMRMPSGNPGDYETPKFPLN